MLFMKEIISFICRKGTFVHSKVWLTLSSNIEGESYLVSPPLSLSWGSDTRQVEGSFLVSSSKPAIACSYDFFMFLVHYHYRTEHEYYRVHREEEGQYHTISIIYIYKIYMFLCLKGTSAEGDFLLCGNGDLRVLEYRGVEDGKERRGIGWGDVGGWSLLPVAASVVVYCCCFYSCGLLLSVLPGPRWLCTVLLVGSLFLYSRLLFCLRHYSYFYCSLLKVPSVCSSFLFNIVFYFLICNLYSTIFTVCV